MKKFILFLLLAISSSFLIMSMDRDTNDTIKIYPQPIRTTARVTSELPITKIEVYTILGSLVIEREDEGELDFSGQAAGYYMIKIYSGKNIFVKRVQKH